MLRPVPSENCRVCGLLYVAEDPADLPWGEDGKNPSFWFCDCCGVEFGYEDSLPEGARRYRKRWLDSGAQWHDPGAQPPRSNLDEQLAAVPPPFR
jgi:hypothetical protein